MPSKLLQSIVSKPSQKYEEIPRGNIDEKASSTPTSPPPGYESHIFTRTDQQWGRWSLQTFLLHGCFLAMHISFAALTITFLLPSRSRDQTTLLPQVIHSPVTPILQHGKLEYYPDHKSKYVRQPSPEIDSRWQKLLSGNFFKLSQEDLQALDRLDDDPVLLEDGSGVGLLNMHHEVHCVMGLWQASHAEYYWPNVTDEQAAANKHHVNHCLDYLLQAAMCHGDVGFMTYHWDMEKPKPYWKPAEHTCVNFEGVRDWLHERKVPIHDPGFLVHPKFGAPYPDGAQEIPTIYSDVFAPT